MLDEILRYKSEELARIKTRVSLAAIQRRAARTPGPPSFTSALRQNPGPALICEVKRASPSGGKIRPCADAGEMARIYADGGAAAISVLTDARFFAGSIADLAVVAQTVPLPVLRKDFIIDPYQIYEARAAGAAAVLLIAAALQDETLAMLHALAGELGMTALVEVHTREELVRAGRVGAQVIGINNRDLRTLKVDLANTAALMPYVPKGCLTVSESGIKARADVTWLASLGVDGVLVGEALMSAPDPAQKLAELTGRRNETGNAG